MWPAKADISHKPGQLLGGAICLWVECAQHKRLASIARHQCNCARPLSACQAQKLSPHFEREQRVRVQLTGAVPDFGNMSPSMSDIRLDNTGLAGPIPASFAK